MTFHIYYFLDVLLTILLWSCVCNAQSPAGTGETSPEIMRTVNTVPVNVGYPDAPRVLETFKSDMTAFWIRHPQGKNNLNKWNAYLRRQLNAGRNSVETGGYNGLARLKWYESLLLSPLSGEIDLESFSRTLHTLLLQGDPDGYTRALAVCAPKMDVFYQPDFIKPDCKTPMDALIRLQFALREIQSLHAQALSKLTPDELGALNENLYNTMTVDVTVGHTVNKTKTARDYLLYAEKIDYSSFYRIGERLFSLTDGGFLENLRQWQDKVDKSNVSAFPNKAVTAANGVQGDCIILETPCGKIILGGSKKNVYQLDALSDVTAIVDFGGDDVYWDGMVNLNRPLLVIIDMAGNDLYQGSNPGIQGSSLLGVSFLLDCSGNDQYYANNLAQGSTIGGVGILLDMGGNDRYKGNRRVQGTAMCGLGWLIDRGGDDNFRAAMWSQGMGHPRGFGLLENISGKDYYYTGGLEKDSYPDTPGYEGWGQGLGAGLRDIANGGIGVFLEGGGDDRYEFDYIAHGGGYWQGIGILRDFGGSDNHSGATVSDYNGKPRKEARFQRFGSGFGCHYAVGILIDDFGDDVYSSNIMNTGFGWDASIGYLFDFQGNDRYLSSGGASQGSGDQAAMGILFDYSGNDQYYGKNPGYAPATTNPEYHKIYECGGNFGLLIDNKGNDKYMNIRINNNSVYNRGGAGGWIIDK